MANVKRRVGTHYSDHGSTSKQPIQLLGLFLDVFQSFLVPNNPRASVGTKFEELKPAVASLELAMNHLIANEIDLQSTLETIAIEGLTSVACAKIAVGGGNIQEIYGEWYDIGQVFVESIGLDNLVVDMQVTDPRHFAYIGDRYRIPLKYVLDSPLYHDTDDLTVTHKLNYNEDGSSRVSEITQSGAGRDEYKDYIELWDMYIPDENIIVTVPAMQDKVIREQEWIGPEGGPYELLSFQKIQDNCMPYAPILDLIDLHDLANEVYRKAQNKISRQKTISVVRGGADEDGNRVVAADDGDMIKLDHPDSIKEIAMGGDVERVLPMFLSALDQFDKHSGNLNSLGGLAAQSATLGQDELLARGASGKPARYQNKFTKYTKRILYHIAWHLYNDPFVKIPIVKKLKGSDGVPSWFTPEVAEGDFIEYNIDIDAFSMQDQSPGEKIGKMLPYVTQVLIPAIQSGMAPGAIIHLDKINATVAKYWDMDEINEFVTFGPPSEEKPVGTNPRQAPNTTRTNIRENRSEATQPGQDANLMLQMMQGNQRGPAND